MVAAAKLKLSFLISCNSSSIAIALKEEHQQLLGQHIEGMHCFTLVSVYDLLSSL